LLEDPGWIRRYDEKIRGDPIVLLDEGWEMPVNVQVPGDLWRLASMELSEDKFPSFKGSPAERLKKLNDRVRQLGWAGLGLWVAAQLSGDGKEDEKLRPEEDVIPIVRRTTMGKNASGVQEPLHDFLKRSTGAFDAKHNCSFTRQHPGRRCTSPVWSKQKALAANLHGHGSCRCT